MRILTSQPCFLLLLMAVFSSCKPPVPDLPRPNIVWIVSEDNSKHYLRHFDETGVETPNIESLASTGLTFTRAFSNAPVCSAARSTIISGCFGPRVGSQFHRKAQMVPLPDSLNMFPAYLRDAGYYTANNAKEDYNFFLGDNVWDESSNKASWKKRVAGQPFFYVHNIGVTHESSLHFPESDIKDKPTKVAPTGDHVFPVHPDTEIFRYTNARYRDNMVKMDEIVGKVLTDLKKEGLMDSTFIFYYGDHGGVLPGSKGYIYESGLHVPMVVHIPEVYKHLVSKEAGSKTDQFVSFIDLGPTVLNLAGVEVPAQMDGKPFLGKGAVQSNDIAYGYADRFDEKYDLVRTVRKGNLKYMRSYQPFNPDGLMNNYRYEQAAYREWKVLYDKGKLNKVQSAFFEPRKAEMLFDLEVDPHETNNLSDDPDYTSRLDQMRGLMNDWVKGMPDLSFFPEHYFLEVGSEDPVKFGRENSERISELIDLANLQLISFKEAKAGIIAGLENPDPWKRYWALIVASAHGIADDQLIKIITEISKLDKEPLNRVRAYEYLKLVGPEVSSGEILQAVYAASHPMEMVLMLNTVVLLRDFHGMDFQIDQSKINSDFLEVRHLLWRIKYINKLL